MASGNGKSGRDLLLVMVDEMLAMKAGQAETTATLGETHEILRVVVQHMETLTRIGQRQEQRLDKVIRVVGELADKFEDHEGRISALETARR